MSKSLWKWDKFEKWTILKSRKYPVYSASQCYHLRYDYPFQRVEKLIIKYINGLKNTRIYIDYPQSYIRKEGKSMMQIDVFFKGELNNKILLKIEEIIKNEEVK